MKTTGELWKGKDTSTAEDYPVRWWQRGLKHLREYRTRSPTNSGNLSIQAKVIQVKPKIFFFITLNYPDKLP